MRSQARPALFRVMQLLLLLLGVTPALAGQVQLAWDAPDPSTSPAGYRLYYWQEPAGVLQSVPVGQQTTYTLTGCEDGATYAFAVTAYDADGNESDDSDIITVTMPTSPTLVSPPPASLLPGPTVLFAWTDGGIAVVEWWLALGTSVGATDLLDSGSLGETQSLTVEGLPTDGEAICVRLYYRVEGDDTWQYSDFTYITAVMP
jgi:Fibronectin type III domain